MPDRDLSSIPEAMRPLVILDRHELLQLVPYSMAHIYRMEAAGTFPLRIRLGPARVGWRLDEIIAWIESRPTAEPLADTI